MEFIYYLSSLSKFNIEAVHLEKFYRVHSKSGAFLCYKPINVDLLDNYFSIHLDKGYNWLLGSKNTLSSFFKYLQRRYDFPNLIKDIKVDLKHYRPNKKPQRILSRHEILLFQQSLIKYSEDLKRDTLLFSLLLSTGCRISEMLNIKVRDVNFSEDAVFLAKTKTKVQRMIMLRDHFGLSIKQYVKERHLCDDDFLFCTQDKKCLTRAQVQKLLTEYLKLSNIEPINIHGIRHTFATLMYESGSELLVIQQMLGHSSLSSTRTYVHPNYVRNYGMVIKENEVVYKFVSELLE